MSFINHVLANVNLTHSKLDLVMPSNSWLPNLNGPIPLVGVVMV